MARIVHVSATLATGIYTIICTLAKYQLKAGHQVFLVGCTRPDDAVANWQDDLPGGVQFIELTMEREIHLRKDWTAMRELRKILKRLSPDAIHLHSSKAGAVGRVAAIGLGANVVYQPNGFSFLRRDVSKIKSAAFGVIESALSLLPGRIVASSAGERNAAKPYLFFRKLDLVNNSIELPQAIHDFRSSRIAREPYRVGTCGRVSPQKDPAFFAEVAKLLADKMQFVWIGGGQYPMGAEQLQSVNAEVTGVVSRQDATMKIADLDVYIQTSAWEGMPISVLEAMAIGVPVVVRDAVGNRDLLEPVTPEHVVESANQMAELIVDLCKNAEYRTRISSLLKSHVASDYSPEAQCQAFEKLYGLWCQFCSDWRRERFLRFTNALA